MNVTDELKTQMAALGQRYTAEAEAKAISDAAAFEGKGWSEVGPAIIKRYDTADAPTSDPETANRDVEIEVAMKREAYANHDHPDYDDAGRRGAEALRGSPPRGNRGSAGGPVGGLARIHADILPRGEHE